MLVNVSVSQINLIHLYSIIPPGKILGVYDENLLGEFSQCSSFSYLIREYGTATSWMEENVWSGRNLGESNINKAADSSDFSIKRIEKIKRVPNCPYALINTITVSRSATRHWFYVFNQDEYSFVATRMPPTSHQ